MSVTGEGSAPTRWAWADVDLDALAHNVRELRRVVAPSDVWAVVKADAYGHGAVPCARAALAAGAAGLCVALAEEGAELRAGGVDAPVLVLSQQPPEQFAGMVELDLTPTLYETAAVEAFAETVRTAGKRDYGVHVKIDTGMHRVGVALGEAVDLVRHVDSRSAELRLAGIFSHLAVADDPADPHTALQLQRFDEILHELARVGIVPETTHLANSAGALAHPAARRSFVRAGIAIYGIEPGAGVADMCVGLRPVMTLAARVSFVQRLSPGERISYGLRHRFERPATVATIPIGYADGVPRRLAECGGEMLIGGRRRPIVGVVTMDQVMVDCDDDHIRVGDEVVLIGAQDNERIRAEDWADALGTIGYEIVCGISRRVPRRYHGRTASPGDQAGGPR
ncbi:MAG: alanine racemase [Acidimicrobiia bacterium]